jgi:hypothetical protein
MLQKGDVVKVLDHSGHISLLPNGKPTHTIDYGGIYSNDKLIVVWIDCNLNQPYEEHVYHNNILIWNETRKYYTFFESRFLKVIGKTCPHCGYILP